MSIKIRFLSKEEAEQREDPQKKLQELQQTKQEIAYAIENSDMISESLRVPSMLSFFVGAGLVACIVIYRTIPPVMYAAIILISVLLMIAGILMINPSVPLRALDHVLDKQIARCKDKLKC